MELHKKIRKGSIVYSKNYINDKTLFEVEDIFKNTLGELMICITRVNQHNGMLTTSEYYNHKYFNILFKFSIIDILKKL